MWVDLIIDTRKLLKAGSLINFIIFSNGFLLVYLVGVLKYFHEEKIRSPCSLIDEHEDDSHKLHCLGGSRTNDKFINGLDLRPAVSSSTRTHRFTLMEVTVPMGYSS